MRLHIAPEFSLLGLAARPAEYRDDEALRRAVAATSDWAAVIEAARRHRVTPLILTSLQAYASQIPAAVLAEIRQQTMQSVGSSLAQIPALDHLCATLSGANIRFLIVKGIPLSLQLYGDATRRTADDIDVLVSPNQFWQADTALTQMGYRCDTELGSAVRRESYTHWVKDLRYTHERFPTPVELHHRLTANPYLLECSFDELWKDRVQVRAGAIEVATLPSGKLPLYLLAHGANHAWERLRWLVDLTTVLQASGIEKPLAEAEQAGLGPPMLQGLVLAHEWLGFPLEARYLEQASTNPKVRWLDRCLGHFFGGATWRRRPQSKSWEWFWRFSIWFFIYNLSLKADWRYRAHQCAAMWVHPPDWNIVRLPPALFWLYPLIRPFAWIKRRLQR